MTSPATEQAISNDKLYRAIWSLIPTDIEEEISKDMNMLGFRAIVKVGSKLIGMTTEDVNNLKLDSRDPMNVLFEAMRNKNSCTVLCKDPEKHFQNKKCFPFYKVLHVIESVDNKAAQHLKSRQLREVVLKTVDEQLQINMGMDSDNQFVEHPVYKLPNRLQYQYAVTSKILTIDFIDLENFDLTQELEYDKKLSNLLKNINENFKAILAPKLPLKLNNRWSNFIQSQIKDCDLIILILTDKMTDILINYLNDNNEDENDENVANIKNDEYETSLSSNFYSNSCIDSLKYLWKQINKSKKPIVGVDFLLDTNNQSELRNSLITNETHYQSVLDNKQLLLVPVVFKLPRDIKLLIGYILRRFC